MKKEIVKASKQVLGMNVKGSNGESLGEIKEIMLDKDTGETQFMILQSGGLLGMGSKLLAMPWDIFSFDPAQKSFVISLNKEMLESLPSFDEDNWPEMNQAWSTSIYRHFGINPMARSSSMAGKSENM
jgi:sporulation protein YlmC with PRC-barrel domain